MESGIQMKGFLLKYDYNTIFQHSICPSSSWIDRSAFPLLLHTYMVVLEV